jgi:hypothetical protein
MSQFQPIPGTLVIGLGHRARQGKDTAAGALIAAYPGDVQRFSFADDLYAVCRVLHGMTSKDAPLLQRVGVEMRENDPDVWVRSVDSKIRDARPPVAVITDLRFPNEFAYVKALGGVCWNVVRRDAVGSVLVDPSRPANHISETALVGAKWDRTLWNEDGRPDRFCALVRDAFADALRESEQRAKVAA